MPHHPTPCRYILIVSSHLLLGLRSNMFPYYLINGRIFGKKFAEHKMCVLIFSTTFVSRISHSAKFWVRCDEKCTSVFMQSTRYSCELLLTLEFSRQIFKKKYSNFMKISPVGAELFHADRRTDRRHKR
jgi:hypothetical protein